MVQDQDAYKDPQIDGAIDNQRLTEYSGIPEGDVIGCGVFDTEACRRTG